MTKKEHIVRTRLTSDGKSFLIHEDGTETPYEPGSGIDWDAINAMTPEDIEYNALMDPDFEDFRTDKELACREQLPAPKRIRMKLKLSQNAFSERFNIPLGTLRDWERGLRFPDSAARAYLCAIAEAPDVVERAVAKSKMAYFPDSSPKTKTGKRVA